MTRPSPTSRPSPLSLCMLFQAHARSEYTMTIQADAARRLIAEGFVTESAPVRIPKTSHRRAHDGMRVTLCATLAARVHFINGLGYTLG